MFGRRKRGADAPDQSETTNEIEAVEPAPEIDLALEADQELVEEIDRVSTAKSAPDDRADRGPLDETEASAARPYVDLGGVKILPREGLHLRLEVEEGSQRVVAVGLDFEGSTLQVQPFAAPRSTGLWHEIREQIAEQIRMQGGAVSDVDGPLGPELRARVPVIGEDGITNETRAARFIGVDGPRWFLRGVIAGPAADDPEQAGAIEELFRSVVVARGTAPMPPRDLIPLHMPPTAPTTAI
nr:DUF3710 domain-containing protein [Curtobacterium ammoniigenes]